MCCADRAGPRRASPGGGTSAAGGARHVRGALSRIQHVPAERNVRRATSPGSGRHGGPRHR